MKKIAVINCGGGNIGSLINALKHLNNEPVLLNKPEKNYDFSHIILPGVGSFGKIAKDYVRFSYAASQENISQALENIKKMLT